MVQTLHIIPTGQPLIWSWDGLIPTLIVYVKTLFLESFGKVVYLHIAFYAAIKKLKKIVARQFFLIRRSGSVLLVFRRNFFVSLFLIYSYFFTTLTRP